MEHHTTARLCRLRRHLGFDRNSLRRDVDRAQFAVGLTLLLGFLAIAPMLSGQVAVQVYESGVRSEREESLSRRLVVAKVVGLAEATGVDRVNRDFARLSWVAPDGTTQTTVKASTESDALGSSRWIWVDAAGKETLRPKSRSQTYADTGFAAAATIVTAGLPLLLCHRLFRRRCDRHREHLWEQAWLELDRRHAN